MCKNIWTKIANLTGKVFWERRGTKRERRVGILNPSPAPQSSWHSAIGLIGIDEHLESGGKNLEQSTIQVLLVDIFLN